MEGPHPVEAALASGRHRVDELFVTPAAVTRDVDLLRLAAADDVRITVVTDRVAATLSDTVTPQGVVAVVRVISDAGLDDTGLDVLLATKPRLVAVLVDVAEPGNAGTVIRTADAAGADAIVLVGNSVDPYNPKCIRASAGSLFHLRVVSVRDGGSLIADLRASGLTVIATTVDATTDLYAPETTGALGDPVAWVFGNEAHGVPAHIAAAADIRVRIPISGRAESLNLAAAAAVCLYETARVRRLA